MMEPASMLERVDENTIMVVPTLGVTYTGAYEHVEADGPARGHRPEPERA
jgi:glutamate/tyrosine decarboxylase-like PLP-dependent enzyme